MQTILLLWTIRVAFVLYLTSFVAWRLRRDEIARATWTLGCALYLVHVAAAFQFVHHWSHDAAYRETARQTAALFGWNWGGGIYFNYLFTLIWIVDAAWWQRGLSAYRERPRYISIGVHVFFAFMFFNAIVFAVYRAI